MKITTFLLMCFFCLSGGLYANDAERDTMMWEEAHKGNFSLVHKLVLS